MFSLNGRRTVVRLLGFSLCSLVGAAAQAATINVTTQSGTLGWDGGCSLPEAILAANTNANQYECPKGASAGTDTILLPENVPIFLSNAPVMTISSNIEIKTNTFVHKRATLHGENVTTSCFSVAPKAKLTFNDVIITGFKSKTAIVLQDGTSSTDRAELVLHLTEIKGNSTSFGAQTANLHVGKLALATINQSIIRGNKSIKGGALLSKGGQVDIRHSVLADNTATQYGGAIHLIPTSDNFTPYLNVINSTIANNTAMEEHGGAIYASSAYGYIAFSTITGNKAGKQGDAIYARAINSGELTLNRNIISDNGSLNYTDCYAVAPANFYSAGRNVLRECDGFSHPNATDKLLSSELLGLGGMPATPAQWYDRPEMVPSFDSPAILAGQTCGGESSDSSYDQNFTFRPSDNICAAGAVDP